MGEYERLCFLWLGRNPEKEGQAGNRCWFDDGITLLDLIGLNAVESAAEQSMSNQVARHGLLGFQLGNNERACPLKIKQPKTKKYGRSKRTKQTGKTTK